MSILYSPSSYHLLYLFNENITSAHSTKNLVSPLLCVYNSALNNLLIPSICQKKNNNNNNFIVIIIINNLPWRKAWWHGTRNRDLQKRERERKQKREKSRHLQEPFWLSLLLLLLFFFPLSHHPPFRLRLPPLSI